MGAAGIQYAQRYRAILQFLIKWWDTFEDLRAHWSSIIFSQVDTSLGGPALEVIGDDIDEAFLAQWETSMFIDDSPDAESSADPTDWGAIAPSNSQFLTPLLFFLH